VTRATGGESGRRRLADATSALRGTVARVRAGAEVAPGLAVVAVVGLLFVPLSPPAVDALLALSLGLAAAVLLAVLLSPDALRLSVFPSLLLLTTLLRLALSVGSTRLVLTRGEAGRVVDALGRVVVQGNWVAGAVVFAILAVVQLLVVAKGAERVAEVAARFSLDALPGKQMAIDAELRAGAIDAAEARLRRRQLERESQLHGAMDGALKFVKGDAIAGIAIALVNALGGTAAGMLRGMPAAASARRHVLLAAGDGLAAQIPSLLLAVAAGIAVTRVSAADAPRGLGREVVEQLGGDARALWAAAGLLGALALAPGFPALPFAALAAAGAAAGVAAGRRDGRRAGPAPALEGPVGDVTFPLPPPASLAVEIASTTADEDPSAARVLPEAGRALRMDLWRRLGVPAPAVDVRLAPLAPGSWALRVEGSVAAAGRVTPGHVLCLARACELALAGIPSRPRLHPLTGEDAAVVPGPDAARARGLAPVLGPAAWSLAEAAAGLHRTAHELVGVQEVQSMLEALEPEAPALVREAARQLPPALVAEVMRRLLAEGVSVRPLRSILQSLLAEGPGAGAPALAERCRRALSRHIVESASAGMAGRPIPVLLLDPAAEGALREALVGEAAAISPAEIDALLESVSSGLSVSPRPRALLAPADVRRAVRNLVAGRFPALAVLAYDELPTERRVMPVGRASTAR
jgi:type III secretion protein V